MFFLPSIVIRKLLAKPSCLKCLMRREFDELNLKCLFKIPKCDFHCSGVFYVKQNKKSHQLIENAVERAKNSRQRFREITENIATVPNFLSLSRICMTPVIGYLVIHEFYKLSAGLFIIAGITDLLDGYIARTFPSQRSALGSALDPLADKLLVSTLFITLSYSGLIPIPLTLLVLSRDALLISSGFYIRYISLPPPKTLSRYFNIRLVTAQVHPTTISKYNTAIQLGLVTVCLGAPIFGYVDHAYLHAYYWLTALSTVISGASYALSKDTVQLLNKHRPK